MERKPWMDQEAPVNYVAGLGRGATGFTTRSDIGPARMQFDPIAEAGANMPPAGRGAGAREDDDDKSDYSESNYDEFMGYSGSLVSNSVYDQDDAEADEIWEAIDDRMDSRRKVRREALLKKEIEKFRATRPKIQQQFADLKRGLSTVSADEWDQLPEPGQLTKRPKAQKIMGYMPVPDAVLSKSHEQHEQYRELDARQQALGGLTTPLGMATPVQQDLTQIGGARKTVLDLKLKNMSDSVSGQTVVDPKGYLTDLNSIAVSSQAEISDLKKARLLLKSVTSTNRKHAPGWIAAARLEEVGGRLVAARKIIAQGCQQVPDNEDVWLEAARLNTPENAKVIVANAIEHVPASVKVWLYAAGLEHEVKAKKRVLRKALERVPNSIKLWKAAIELEPPEDARVLLGRAVECVPHSVEMWLALARLETYQNARKVLNKAREMIPTDAQIWITASKLEEANGNVAGVSQIIKRAVKSLQAHGVVINRDAWLKEAEAAEAAGAPVTCNALVHETVGLGVDDEDRKRTWLDDAESAIAHSSYATARAIYGHALTVFPAKKSIWLRVAHLAKEHPDPNAPELDTLDSVLQRAVKYCPQSEVLWLMAAKEKWHNGDVDGARVVLHNAFQANPDSEQIWLAAVKLENENSEVDRARSLLRRARERAGTERVWMKAAQLERDARNSSEEAKILDEALVKYPRFAKFWLMRAQLEVRENRLEQAREFFSRGLKNCSNSVALWLSASQLEERVAGTAKARSMLEKARLSNPKNAELWVASVRVEMRAGSPKMAQTLMAKALQECPTAGLLWAEQIEMEARPQKRSRSVDALKKCDNDVYVIAAVAKLFWADRKIDKARQWLTRAVTLNKDYGDAWALFYKFECMLGDGETQAKVVKRCTDADPHHGEHWQSVAKDINNSRLKTDEILKLVADRISSPD
eukprot:TRINITY_DN6254_c0_g1_i1.p1 TRINITY_DN6254_c0_g1~~TRINITY_DN6254_c0_g1_i1.p1  ORF type:complete len:925 (-),score=402.90 TRINITY_DN6254_c0_g1_i1:208-2982(-)